MARAGWRCCCLPCRRLSVLRTWDWGWSIGWRRNCLARNRCRGWILSRAFRPSIARLVAVPTMLTSAAGVEHLLDGLEVRYLANRDPCLHFALLTDFVDAAAETLPGDAELVRLAREGIERLNEKYANLRGDIFYLFHRARRWNAQEGVWMGYERKRGKLADLNAMLRGATGPFRGSRRRDRDSARACAMSSRSIPTRNCRAMRRARWWARWPIGSIGRCSMRNAAASSRATPFCSRASASACPARSGRASCSCIRGDAGSRSVHARRVRCLPGSVRRRLVHRQGNLRRRFLRAVLRRLSRERDSQPRLDRGRLLPFGLAQRRDAVRRISVALCGRHRPPASLDARRLADCRVAAAVGARSGGQARPQSDLRLVAVEDFRQLAPQPGAGRDAARAARSRGSFRRPSPRPRCSCWRASSCCRRYSPQRRICFASRWTCRCGMHLSRDAAIAWAGRCSKCC